MIEWTKLKEAKHELKDKKKQNTSQEEQNTIQKLHVAKWEHKAKSNKNKMRCKHWLTFLKTFDEAKTDTCS